MRKVMCVNHHYFDADKYSVCQICGQGEAIVSGTEETAKEPEGNRIVSDKKQKKSLLIIGKKATKEEQKSSISAIGPTETIQPIRRQVENNDGAIPAERPLQMPKTESLFDLQPTSDGLKMASSESAASKAIERADASAPVTPASRIGNNTAAESFPQSQKADGNTPATPLQHAVQKTESINISPLSKTVAYYETDSTEPPVGWMVGLNRSCLGKSFCLCAGKNNIGRSAEMDVVICDDTSVSREHHASIVYEPLHRQFIIQAGSGNGLTYVNEELVLTPKELHSFDVIMLGKAKFIFLALCGEKFSWDEYIGEPF